jgi:hypothetical protein
VRACGFLPSVLSLLGNFDPAGSKAISEILVADPDLESGAVVSDVEDYFEEEEEEEEQQQQQP